MQNPSESTGKLHKPLSSLLKRALFYTVGPKRLKGSHEPCGHDNNVHLKPIRQHE